MAGDYNDWAIGSNVSRSGLFFTVGSSVKADIRTDEAGDDADIQTGINMAQSSNMGLVIEPGEFDIDAAIEITDSNLIIRGSGVDITTLVASTEMTSIFFADTTLENIVITDMTIDINSQLNTGGILFYNAPYSRIVLRRVKFKNTVGSYQARVGYAGGTISVPTTRATELDNLSTDILYDNCIFDQHSTTTLEQSIMVNTRRGRYKNCTFKNNDTDAASAMIYGYGNNCAISRCNFIEPKTKGIAIQQSDYVDVSHNTFTDDGSNFPRFVEVINSQHVGGLGNTVLGQGSAGSGATFVGVIDFTAATFDSVHTAVYTNSDYINFRKTEADKIYSVCVAPAQTGSGKGVAMKNIEFEGVNLTSCEGSPFTYGHTSNTGMAGIKLRDIKVGSYKGDDTGVVSIIGASGADITDIELENIVAPASSQGGASAYGAYMDYVEGVSIKDCTLPSKGDRKGIHLVHDDLLDITDNTVTTDTPGLGGVQFSSVRGTVKRNLGASNLQELETIIMQNKQGGNIVAGDTVILVSAGAGNQVSHTTSGGDARLFGVVAETIANDAYGHVAVNRGKIVTLKVDGTTDIAINDYLTSFTSAGIARKAASGELAHAIALEAYTTNDSAGVIDALLIPIRQAP